MGPCARPWPSVKHRRWSFCGLNGGATRQDVLMIGWLDTWPNNNSSPHHDGMFRMSCRLLMNNPPKPEEVLQSMSELFIKRLASAMQPSLGSPATPTCRAALRRAHLVPLGDKEGRNRTKLIDGREAPIFDGYSCGFKRPLAVGQGPANGLRAPSCHPIPNKFTGAQTHVFFHSVVPPPSAPRPAPAASCAGRRRSCGDRSSRPASAGRRRWGR